MNWLSENNSLISLNGIALPMCVEYYRVTAQEAYDDNYVRSLTLVSDTPTCYMLADVETWEYELTPSSTSAPIWLKDDFDTTAPGTVSIAGSTPFAFNQVAGEDDEDTTQEPAVSIGTAPAGSTVVVTVQSDPVTCSTTADQNGDWSCTPPATLPAGQHAVTVVVTTLDGQTINLRPYTVFVNGENATTLPGAPNTGLQRLSAFVKTPSGGLFVTIGALSVLIAVALFVIIRRRRTS